MGYNAPDGDNDFPGKGSAESDDRAAGEKIAMNAAKEIDDIRQTATGRMTSHRREAERFRILAEAHEHAAKLYGTLLEQESANAVRPRSWSEGV